MKRYVPFILDNLIWLLLLAALAIFTILTPDFLTQRNLKDILEHASVLGLMVIGQSFTLISGNFDLSAESVLGLTGLVGAWLVTTAGAPANGSGLELSPLLAVPIMLALGLFIGAINGFLITRLKMNNFIVTLAMLIILRGVVLVLNRGVTIARVSPAMRVLGHTDVAGFPLSVLVMLLLFVVAFLIMRYTQLGRDLYAVGGNPEAAQASGIDVDRRVRQAYLISAVLAALAGWMFIGRLGTGVASMGKGMIFEVQAAAVIGGISLFGGRGSMIGALGGMLLLSVFNSGLMLMRISSFVIDAVRGLIILLAVIIDAQKVSTRQQIQASAVTTRVAGTAGSDAPAAGAR